MLIASAGLFFLPARRRGRQGLTYGLGSAIIKIDNKEAATGGF